jgi:hypothetical protein
MRKKMAGREPRGVADLAVAEGEGDADSVRIAQGLKPSRILASLSARLKSCPVTKRARGCAMPGQSPRPSSLNDVVRVVLGKVVSGSWSPTQAELGWGTRFGWGTRLGWGTRTRTWGAARRRDFGRASMRASNWPVGAAKGPGLPCSSSMRRVSGRRQADQRGQPPPGVYQLRTEGYHTRSVNVL